MKKVKVYIFEGVFRDYSCGLAVGVATNQSNAALEVCKTRMSGRTIAEYKETDAYKELMSVTPTVIDPAKGETGGAYVYGGG